MSGDPNLNRNSSVQGFPQISPRVGGESLLHDFHKTKTRLSSALGSKAQTSRAHYNPPNITAFKIAQLGFEGTLLHSKNQQLSTHMEAELVETRVKKLQKEEDKMLKKIEQTRKQAEMMQKQHDENNLRFRQKQQHHEEQ